MSETKLDFTSGTAQPQREIDKLTKTVAKLREEVRVGNQNAKQGFSESSNAVQNFASKLTQASASTGKWADGMKRMQLAASLLKSDFSSLTAAMHKSVSVKDPFEPWVKGLANVRSGNDKWAAGMKNITAASAAGKHEFEMVVTKMRDSDRITRMVADGFTGLSGQFNAFGGPAAIAAAGVAVVTRELMKFNEEQAGAVQHHREWQDELAKTIAGGKEAGSGGKLEAFTKSVPGATKADALLAFQGASSEMQSSSFEKKAEVAGAVARLGITGADIGKGGAGGMAGFLAQDILPNYKGKDAADVAAMLQQEAGGDFEKIGGESAKRAMQQLISSGAMTPEESVGTILAGSRADVSPKTISQIAKTAASSKESIGGIGESGKVAAANRKLGRMSPRERVAAMLSDKAMAEAGLGENAIELANSRLSMDEITANAALVSGVQNRDVIGERRQGMATSEAGRGRASRYQNVSTKEQQEAAMTRRNTLLSDLDSDVRARSAGKGFVARTAGEAAIAVRQSSTLMGFGPDASEGSIRGLEVLVDLSRRQLQVMEQQAKRRLNVDEHTE